MKGFRTITVGLALAVLPNALSYLGGIDWTQHVDPSLALTISGVLTIALRCLTTTPVGSR